MATFEAQPVGAPRGHLSAQIVDFRRLPQIAADEIRFVVATKVRRGDWTPNTSLRRFLMVLIDTADGPVIVYAMETDDLARSRSVTDQSPRPIDAEHRVVMRAADDGPASAEVVLDLRPA